MKKVDEVIMTSKLISPESLKLILTPPADRKYAFS